MKRIVPIALLTGYLGAGKTTLLNHVLNNQEGYKVAVIVNDIGEVNIDASLLSKDGVVAQKDDNLVPLQNGCICCTLKEDLLKQIADLAGCGKFDYIFIEASGICEPVPIVQTIEYLADATMKDNKSNFSVRLDNLISVVDACRLRDEFGSGRELLKEDIEDDDIENLLIQQIEFCSKIIINKVKELSESELKEVENVVKALQPEAEIIETNFGKVDLAKIMNTNAFDFEKAATSAAWIKGLEEIIETNFGKVDLAKIMNTNAFDFEKAATSAAWIKGLEEIEEEEEPEGEALEYGIGTFVYKRRQAFDTNKFIEFANKKYPSTIIRAKGVAWITRDEKNMYMFEQAGKQKVLQNSGPWLISCPKREQQAVLKECPDIAAEWDPVLGDKMVKLVFIGKNMDRAAIEAALDACLK